MKSACARKAVILAAGFGERLRPLTLVKPKPLMPVWGVPMIERIVMLLRSWGVKDFMVNAHHLPDQVEKWCRDYAMASEGEVSVSVSRESEILGTGGVLKPLKGWIGDEPFWLVNGDIVIEDLDPEPIVQAFERSGRFAGAWISGEFGPKTVEPDFEGRICNWHSDIAGDWGTATYCGAALLSPDVIGYLPDRPKSSIVEAYENAMMKDARFVVGTEVEGSYWADAGTLERYLEAHAALDSDRFSSNPNVIFEGVKLLDSADLAGTVITGGLIGGDFTRTAIVGVKQLVDAGANGDGKRLAALAKEMGWPIDDAAAEFLGARGSDRSFWRLICGNDRAIAILYDDSKRGENARYASHARLLDAAGVRAVKVLADLPGEKALAMEDLGAESLESRAKERGANLARLYAPVIEEIRKFHEKGLEAACGVELESAFGDELFAWERALFEDHAVKGRWGLDGLPAKVKDELESVAAELASQPQVLLHRDFQSSNVLYRDGKKPVFIDFQGMRLGPAAYDMASLLYDPYVPLDELDRKKLKGLYPVPALEKGAVQRLVQAIGAFCRLSSVGQTRFEGFILPALQNLLEAADDAGLDAVGAFAEDMIAREGMRSGHSHGHHGHHGRHGGSRR